MRRLVWVVALIGLAGAACGGSSSASRTAKYCDAARKLGQDLKLNGATDYKATFQQFDSFADQFLATVPGAIKNDANALISAVRQLETAMKNANYDITKIDQSTLKSLNAPEFTAAANRVADFNTKNCGIANPLTTTTLNSPTS